MHYRETSVDVIPHGSTHLAIKFMQKLKTADI
jgi:hypothetical protein